MAPSTDKHGVDPIEKRRSRNRMSQRHFRERRERYVKELEERLKFFNMNERDQDAKLIRDYDALRAVLHKTRSQLERLRTGVEELCTTMDGFSDPRVGQAEESQTNNGCRREAASIPNTMIFNGSDAQCEDGGTLESMLSSESCTRNTALITTELNHLPGPNMAHEEQDCPITYKEIPSLDAISCDINVDLDQMTTAVETYIGDSCMDQLHLQNNIYDFSGSDYPTPPLETFGNSLLVSFSTGDSWFLQRLYTLLDREFATTQNAPLSLSEHIDRAIGLVRDYLKVVGGFNSYTKTSQACIIAMIVFTRYVSPLPATMWFTSYCYLIIEKVMFWQVHQNGKSACSTTPAYEPSALQLSTKHSSLIDWIILPPLRDRFIATYNRSHKLDHIFVDLMKHTVVEVADLSKILIGAPEGPGFLGVWNLFNAMNIRSHEDTQAVCNGDAVELQDHTFAGLIQMHKMPPPDDTWVCQVTCPENGYWQSVSFGELLGSPQLAKKLYHYLRVYDAHRHWKIDPAFFEIYPELKYEGFESSCAQGTSYRLTSSWVGLPM